MKKKEKKEREIKPRTSAMEFLITYSWAILVILVGLGIFVYFGLINIEGSSCKITPKLKCTEFTIEKDKIVLTVKNNMDQLLLGVDIGAEDCIGMDLGNILDKDNEEIFVITGCDNLIGEDINKNINITYTTEDGKTYTRIGKIIKTTT